VPTLYRNARLHQAPDVGSAVLVEDQRFAWIGPDGDAPGGPTTRVVDLDGAWVLPAFVDAHVHMTATGLALTGLDLSAATSLAQALELLERAARAARGRPLLGGGWDETGWPEQRAPTARELDRAAYGGAVYLARVDAHSAVISSALAASVPGLAGLAGYGPDGWLRRDAHDAARVAALAALSPARIRDAQRAALRHAAGLGIACVHEMAGPAISSAEDLAGLLELAWAEPVPEVIGYWGELFGIDTALELGAVGVAGDLFLDGSIGSHTAAMGQPYADRPDETGRLRFATADVAEHIARCETAGLQAGFHAIGDAAVDQALDAVEAVRARSPITPPARHRIEHAEFVRDPARLARAGLIASMQPMFDAAWGGAAGMYAQRLGAERAAGLNRFADLAAAGVPLAFGSDAPVTALGPWAAVRAAAAPHDRSAAITVEAAFAAHTTGGWRAAGRAGEGTLTPGAPATFAAWRGGAADTDPLAATDRPDCVRTVLRGRPIHGDTTEA
jgi:predicted amidohydrolase YtcJ